MIEIQEHGKLRELRLARPPVNALSDTLVRDLRAALAQAHKDGKQGIILSGSPGMFSAGLDLKVLLGLSRDEMRHFWEEFFSLLRDLASSPCPVVAAMTGHSPAGGAVLALFCDRRILAQGDFRVGLNEVQVGLVVPWPIQRGLVRLLGARRAEQLLVSGALLGPDEALAVGFADEVVAAESVIDRSIHWLEAMIALPQHAMLATRKLLRSQYAEPFEQLQDEDYELMLDGWFSESTQRHLRAVLERLGSKNR